ncbi:hypothetical protein BU26DRAFT_510368 [Trematosphaeria pertusa]|uniref:Probable double zinc ribbon domain-containing protein n=1 Tax=Trematosphaeria pertusa TaxID=390896 RepID=A0A6A6HXK9_9PLEO|nr:uncharacterized protein BU26DRAFT_510368 [Trematosphaeria pertusa]KAF2242508.1 hypothetical protein BU26DRAFT_510368 [Trematosphaeria pertusa]
MTPRILNRLSRTLTRRSEVTETLFETLLRQLDAAERANPREPGKPGYPKHHPQNTGPVADGLWLCCHCRTESELELWRGDYPFKHLTCPRCDHIICRECCTTAVFTPLEEGSGRVLGWRGSPNEEPRFGQMDEVTQYREQTLMSFDFPEFLCVCGYAADDTWIHFFIGLADEHRGNSDASAAQISVQKAGGAAGGLFEARDRQPLMVTPLTQLPPYRPPASDGAARLPSLRVVANAARFASSLKRRALRRLR